MGGTAITQAVAVGGTAITQAVAVAVVVVNISDVHN